MNKDIIVWENVNVRPMEYNTRDFNRGDCTTRALTYSLNFLGDNRTYKEIEDEQYRLAKIANETSPNNSNYNYHRNSNGI